MEYFCKLSTIAKYFDFEMIVIHEEEKSLQNIDFL